jgi:hypothetical protein
MTKTEEELMRQLVAVFGAQGLPQLRARSNVRGEGWTMELVVADRIVGIGRNARRGAAGEAALSSALQAALGRGVMPQGGLGGGSHHSGAWSGGGGGGGGDDDADAERGVVGVAREVGGGPVDPAEPSCGSVAAVIGVNNMSGAERQLMERLRGLCRGKSAPVPQLRAKRNPRGEDGWTMDVVLGDRVLSTAHGKRRCIAGERALHKAIAAYGAFSGHNAAVSGPPTVDGLTEAEAAVEAALLAELAAACVGKGAMVPPRLRPHQEKVWGKNWFRVEVQVLLGEETAADGSGGGRERVWVAAEAKLAARAAAGAEALQRAIETVHARPPAPMSLGVRVGGGGATAGAAVGTGGAAAAAAAGDGVDPAANAVVPLAYYRPGWEQQLMKVRSLCAKAGIKGEVHLRNADEELLLQEGGEGAAAVVAGGGRPGKRAVAEVTGGDRVLGVYAAKRWEHACEAAWAAAVERVSQMLEKPERLEEARSGLHRRRNRGDDLHGIRVVAGAPVFLSILDLPFRCQPSLRWVRRWAPFCSTAIYFVGNRHLLLFVSLSLSLSLVSFDLSSGRFVFSAS